MFLSHPWSCSWPGPNGGQSGRRNQEPLRDARRPCHLGVRSSPSSLSSSSSLSSPSVQNKTANSREKHFPAFVISLCKFWNKIIGSLLFSNPLPEPCLFFYLFFQREWWNCGELRDGDPRGTGRGGNTLSFTNKQDTHVEYQYASAFKLGLSENAHWRAHVRVWLKEQLGIALISHIYHQCHPPPVFSSCSSCPGGTSADVGLWRFRGDASRLSPSVRRHSGESTAMMIRKQQRR